MDFKTLGENLGLDEEEYRELVELFLDTGSADLDNLKLAFNDKDASTVAKTAHTLNGASGNLGLLDVHEVAKKIEMAANENQFDGMADDIGTLEKMFADVSSFVNG